MSRENVRVLAATFVMDAAWGLSSIYLALEIYEELGLNGYFAALSINSLAGFVGTILLGIATDLLNFRRFLVMSASIVSVSLMCCVLSDANLLSASFLLGLLLSYEPTVLTHLSEEIEEGKASGTYYTVSRMGISIGTFLGGILLDHLKLKGLLILSSLLFLLVAPTLPEHAEERGRSAGRAIKRSLWFLGPIVFMEGFIIPLTYSLLEIKLYDSLGRSASLIGSLYSASTVIEIIAGPSIGRLVDRLGGMKSFLYSSASYSISLMACVSLHDPVSMALLLILPINPFYFSARNKLAVELAGGSGVLTLSIPTSVSSLSDALFYGVLSVLT